MNDQYEVLDRFTDKEKGEMIRVRFPDGIVDVYKYRTMDDVLKMYENDGRICLDYCYIKDFNVKQLSNLENAEKPELKDFSAYSAFFDGSTIFKEAKFSEEADFEHAEFSGGANFEHAEFSGKADFLGAKFSGKADFEFAKYSGKATFGFAMFSGMNDFHKSTFCEEVDFNFAKFSERADFWAAKFSGEAVFLAAKFSEWVSFNEATFSTAKFEYVTFSDGANFNYINCSRQLLFSNCTFKDKVSLKKISIDTLVFDNCTNEYLLDMHSEPQEINSLAFKYMNNIGHFNLNWEAYKAALIKGVNDENEESEKGGQDYRSNQFKMLKENYHNLGDYDAEDEAYVEFKRVERKKEKNFKSYGSWLFDLIGGYGTKPLRIIATMIVVISIFALLFSNEIPFIQISMASGFENIGGAFYYSMINFFTIGFGNIEPVTPAAIVLVFLEGLMGAFLISFFSVAFVRKILR